MSAAWEFAWHLLAWWGAPLLVLCLAMLMEARSGEQS